MMRLTVLASSSKGNASLICTDNTRILIDVGISATRITKALAECNLHPKQLDGIFITHEHGDHCCGLGNLSKKHEIKVFCTRHTGVDIRLKAPNAIITNIEVGSSVQIGDLLVSSFATSHDATDPVCFRIDHEDKKLGFITDTGVISKNIIANMQQLDALYIESNYDMLTLTESRRPIALIRRISSQFGHLSNEQAADFVKQIAQPKLKHIILGHLSQDCNLPSIAHSCMDSMIRKLELDIHLHCASPIHRSPWFTL